MTVIIISAMQQYCLYNVMCVDLQRSFVSHFLYHIRKALVLLIFFCSCNMPYSNASAVGGQPGT